VPAVFVHGVPDTEHVWDALRARLFRQDTVTIGLPGFGIPLPDGFVAGKDEYAHWLMQRLSAIEGPIDLVGHDWGALLVLRCVSMKTERIRSWVAGGAPIDAKYVWHDTAQMWQTPEVGEQVMQLMTPAAVEPQLLDAGIPANYAHEAAARIDDRMKDSILKLYRSAVNVGIEWEGDLSRINAPGLVLWGEQDPYVTPDFGSRLAHRANAEFISYPNCGHWWQQQRPADVAADLQAFWAKVPAKPETGPLRDTGSLRSTGSLRNTGSLR
jgi:pimeloyl-ACP methyl ester carboxylesterase